MRLPRDIFLGKFNLLVFCALRFLRGGFNPRFGGFGVVFGLMVSGEHTDVLGYDALSVVDFKIIQKLLFFGDSGRPDGLAELIGFALFFDGCFVVYVVDFFEYKGG
jgi:hypothetical protein